MIPQTPKEIGDEAREALKKSKETPQEHFDRLVRRGWINSRGKVTRILGGDAEPETPGEATANNEH